MAVEGQALLIWPFNLVQGKGGWGAFGMSIPPINAELGVKGGKDSVPAMMLEEWNQKNNSYLHERPGIFDIPPPPRVVYLA
jgi:hypothetical protein